MPPWWVAMPPWLRYGIIAGILSFAATVTADLSVLWLRDAGLRGTGRQQEHRREAGQSGTVPVADASHARRSRRGARKAHAKFEAIKR
jgi:hypothetical protein